MIPFAYLVATLVLSIAAYKFVIYPALISPLARLPIAHPLCSLTSRWFQNRIKTQRECKTLFKAHQEGGPIVRIGPAEVSVASSEGLRKVYVAGMEKTDWYGELFMSYGHRNLVSMLDSRTHSTRKRILSGIYSKSSIQHSTEMQRLSNMILNERVVPLLQRSASDGNGINVVEMLQWVMTDFMTAFIFGNGTNFTQGIAARNVYFPAGEKLGESIFADNKKAKAQVVLDLCRSCASTLSEKTAVQDSHLAFVFGRLYSQLHSDIDRSGASEEDVLRRVASEILDHMMAAQDTSPITLTYVLWHLSQNATMQADLRSELLSLQTPPKTDAEAMSLPSASDLDRMPLLHAVIYETLRLNTPAPARLPRVVPPEGVTLHEHFIPGGTTISSNAYTLHRDEQAFPEPLKWLPQRWMTVPAEKVTRYDAEAMRRHFWAFGSGGRMCIGSNFAMLAMKQLLAAIYTNYTTSIIDDEGIEQADSFVAGPVGGKLILGFTAVGE